MKKIPSQIIKEALEQIDEEEYSNAMLKLLQEKARRISFKNEFDKKSKLIRYAQGKGFEYDLIARVLDQLG